MKFTYIIAVILIMVFSMGAQCSRNTAEVSVDSPWYGGIIGLTAEFEEIDSVSDTGSGNEVWEDEEFPLVLQLMNKGEFTVDAHLVELELKGISRNDFSGIDFDKDNSERLEGVSELMPEGDVEWIDFGDARYNNLVGTHYDANIFAYFTYPYDTFINIPKVCYKENIRDNTICDVDSTKQAFASGGPVAVGTVTERYIGRGKILLEIPIKNLGKGRMKPYLNDEFRPNFDEFAFTIDAGDWTCSARGNPSVARITHPSGEPGNEEVVLRCINDNLEAGALYTRAVTLTLSYYYQDWIEQRVRIRENPD